MERLKQRRRNVLKVVGMGVGIILLSGIYFSVTLAAEIYPARKITWINPTKAGGGSDLVARTVVLYLGKYLKEVKGAKGGEVVLRNVPEARGNKAYNMIFHAKPDGYTIGDFNNAFVTENITSQKIEFDYNKFTYIARTGVNTHILLARKDGPKNWEEMMAAGKQKELKWGTANFGGSSHVSCILLKEAAKIPARIINFPGAAEAANALLRGDVNILTTSESTAKSLIDAGEFRVLTVFGEKSQYKGVPSISQLGFSELTGPLGQNRLVIGPPNLPKEVVDTLVAGLKKVLSDKEFLAQGEKVEFEPNPLYGADAEKQAQKLFKYYDDMTPILKKYLQ
ncbi:MAG: tripartite tricarboxylate transporter substrate binding protein [Thermodesulfobacteriota bacterium]